MNWAQDALGIPAGNQNGWKVVESCAKKNFCGGNTYFKRENKHELTMIIPCYYVKLICRNKRNKKEGEGERGWKNKK